MINCVFYYPTSMPYKQASKEERDSKKRLKLTISPSLSCTPFRTWLEHFIYREKENTLESWMKKIRFVVTRCVKIINIIINLNKSKKSVKTQIQHWSSLSHSVCAFVNSMTNIFSLLLLLHLTLRAPVCFLKEKKLNNSE